LTQSVLDKIQSLKNKSVFGTYKEYVLFIENSKLRLEEIQGYFVANCIPVCQNRWRFTNPNNYTYLENYVFLLLNQWKWLKY